MIILKKRLRYRWLACAAAANFLWSGGHAAERLAASEHVEGTGPSNSAAEQLWSLQPPKAHPLPPISKPDWPLQRIDHFVLARLDLHQLAPSPATDKRTLIRRLSFDLTGLPPTIDQIEEYIVDESPEATARLVDRLLSSPHFGERLASFWLTLARYGENQAHDYKGYLEDNYPNAYRYRDWVIAAFNDDLPYDDFVRLQLAADFVEGEQSEHLAALGFLGLGPKYFGRAQLDVMADEWADGIETISGAFLGMTIACARCHDHKYDPIAMEDYYAVAGVMASTEYYNTHEIKVVEDEVKDEIYLEYDPQTLHIVRDRDPRDLPVFVGGDVELQGEVVARGLSPAMSGRAAMRLASGSGRGELADSIVSDENPLAARVIVNRVWELLFGRALVATPSNFGHRGGKPSHPMLLDDLAVRFMQNGWSLKWLVKELVLSATYQQGVAANERFEEVDPANKWYWKMLRRKLPAEMWRDATLAACGELDADTVGGPSGDLNDRSFRRRTVYSSIDRRRLTEYLDLFDYPNPNSHRPRRDQTISPLQKLYLLNHPFVLDRAESLANSLLARFADNQERISLAYELLFARPPDEEEVKLGKAFLTSSTRGHTDAWQLYVQTLMTANEMLYLE